MLPLARLKAAESRNPHPRNRFASDQHGHPLSAIHAIFPNIFLLVLDSILFPLACSQTICSPFCSPFCSIPVSGGSNFEKLCFCAFKERVDVEYRVFSSNYFTTNAESCGTWRVSQGSHAVASGNRSRGFSNVSTTDTKRDQRHKDLARKAGGQQKIWHIFVSNVFSFSNSSPMKNQEKYDATPSP